MRPPEIKGKRILISVSIGRCIKNFLLTELYRTLVQTNRILICGEVVNKPGFQEAFGHPNVEFHPGIAPKKGRASRSFGLFNKASVLADFIAARISVRAKSWYLRQLFGTLNLVERPLVLISGIVYLALRNNRGFRRTCKKWIGKNNPADELFDRWQPDMTVLLTPTYAQDALLGVAANFRHVPAVMIPSSWDNVLLNGEMLFDPDCVLSWSENMSRLAGKRWKRGRGRSANVGQIPFDEYDSYEPSPRVEFLEKVGLPKDADRLITYVASTPSTIANQGKLLADMAKVILEDSRNSLVVRHVLHHDEISALQKAVSGLSRIGESLPHPAFSGNLEESYPKEDPIQGYYDLLYYSDLLILSSPSMMSLEGAEFGKPSILIGFDEGYCAPGIPLIEFGLQMVQTPNHGVVAVYSKEDLVKAVESMLEGGTAKKDLESISHLWDMPRTNRTRAALRALSAVVDSKE